MYIEISLILIVIWLLVTSHVGNFPPSPKITFPIIGDSFSIGSSVVKGFESMREKFGRIFGCWIGSMRTVVLSDFNLIENASEMPELSSRPFAIGVSMERGRVSSEMDQSIPGLLLSDGKNWNEQRKFALHFLKDLGVSQKYIENIVLSISQDLCKFIEKKMQICSDPGRLFQKFSANVIWTVVFGDRLSFEDERLDKIVDAIKRPDKKFGDWYYLQSTLTNQMSTFLNIKDLRLNELKDIINEAIKADDETDRPECNKNDFLDAFRLEMNAAEAKLIEATFAADKFTSKSNDGKKSKKRKENKLEEKLIRKLDSVSECSFKGVTGQRNVVSSIMDMFTIGVQATGETLNWIFLYMLANENIKNDVEDEINQIKQNLQFSDRNKTPLTEATIHEVQRLSSVYSLGIFRCTKSKCVIDDYTIPNHTQVIFNHGAVHKNEKHFQNATEFNPRRFLNKNQTFEADRKVCPFGLGNRKCCGEILAKIMIFTAFSTIVKRFNIEKIENISTESNYRGGMTIPKPYQIKFIPK